MYLNSLFSLFSFVVPLHKYANCAFLLIRNKEEIHRKTTLSSTFLIRIRFRTNVNLSLQYLHGGSLKITLTVPLRPNMVFCQKSKLTTYFSIWSGKHVGVHSFSFQLTDISFPASRSWKYIRIVKENILEDIIRIIILEYMELTRKKCCILF